MLALLQRVKHANVAVDNKVIGEIQHGLLVFIGVEKEDSTKNADRLLERVLGYRIFSDKNDRMNLNVQEVNGGLLLIPQFTLAADTKKGMRPSFTPAAAPLLGKTLFDEIMQSAREKHPTVAQGQFGAYMQITLCNDGPVTFLLKS